MEITNSNPQPNTANSDIWNFLNQEANKGNSQAQAIIQTIHGANYSIENLWNVTENARASAQVSENLSLQLRDTNALLHTTQIELEKTTNQLINLKSRESNFAKRTFEIKKIQNRLYACIGTYQKEICINFIQNITLIVNYSKNIEQIGYLLLPTNTMLGQIYIDKQMLYRKKILDVLQSCAGFMISVEGIPATKLATAFSLFIEDTNNHDGTYTIYTTCGWHSNQYFCFDSDDNTWNVLTPYINPKTMLTQKSLLKTNPNTTIRSKASLELENISLWIWRCSYFGSLILSLLLQNGLQTIPIVCINQTEYTENFIHKHLTLWAEFQSRCSSNHKIELKNCIAHACDEPLIINDSLSSSNRENNMHEIVSSISSSTSCMNSGYLKSIPFVISSNIFDLADKYNIDFIPLILDAEFSPCTDSRTEGANFIAWIEANYEDVIALLEYTLKTTTTSSNEQFFKSMIALCSSYYRKYHGTAILDATDLYASTNTRLAQNLSEYCRKFYHFNLESFCEMFWKEFSKHANTKIEPIANYNEHFANVAIYYGNRGDCYVCKDFFRTLCCGMGFSSSRFLLQQLHVIGAIEAESNGNNKTAYTTKSNPLNKRMVHFYPNKLITTDALDLSGYLFKEGILIGRNSSGINIFIPDNPMHPGLTNANMSITGKSGSGKSTLAKTISNNTVKQGIPVLCLDHANDITENEIRNHKTMESYTLQDFPVNPLKSLSYGKKNFAPTISHALTMLLQLNGDESASLLKAVSTVEAQKLPLSFDSITKCLAKINTKPAKQMRTQLLPYTDRNFFSSSDMTWENLLYNTVAKFHVLKFHSSVSQNEREFLSELILFSFTDWIMTAYNKHEFPRPVMVLLDEIRHLSAKKGMPLRTLLQEGRGHGCMITAITQSIVELDNEQRDILMNSGYQIHFQQTPNAKRILAGYAYENGLSEEELELFKKTAGRLASGHALAHGIFSETGEATLCEISCSK